MIFHDNVFPYAEDKEKAAEINSEPGIDTVIDDEMDFDTTTENVYNNEDVNLTEGVDIDEARGSIDRTEELRRGDDGVGGISGNEEENLGRGHRQHKPSVLLKDFVTYSARCLKEPTRAEPKSKQSYSGMAPYPISNYVTCANC